MRKHTTIACLALSALCFCACTETKIEQEQLRQASLNSAAEIIAAHLCDFDNAVSYDGQGSLRVTATDSMVFPVARYDDLNIDDAVLIYRAHVKSENLKGQAFLEMWCQFDGQGEFFSRDISTPLTGSMDWSTEEIPFFLKPGQRPSSVKLNLVVTGPGTVWIDDISLLKMPLQ